MKGIFVTVELSNPDYEHTFNFFPCDTMETAKRLFAEGKEMYKQKIDEWTGGDYEIETDTDTHFEAQYNYWEGYIELAICEKDIITNEDF